VALDTKDLEDVKLARPVAVVDLWSLDDRITQLEEITERLEKVGKTLVTLYHEERVKSWEIILKEMMKQKDRNGFKTKTR
jgi:hypothetical protein